MSTKTRSDTDVRPGDLVEVYDRLVLCVAREKDTLLWLDKERLERRRWSSFCGAWMWEL